MNANNRIPWIVAAAAMLFAMIVLVRNEISPSNTQPYVNQPSIQPVMQASEPQWRSTENRGETPPKPRTGDFSPWGAETKLRTTPTPTPAPTPTPTPPPPTPTPTPKPTYTFRGIVLGDDGEPVSKALVRIVSGKERAAERSAISGDDGRFTIDNIPDESLDKVIVDAKGYSVRLLENIPLPLPDELQIGMNPLAGIDAIILDFSTTNSEPRLFSGEMQASLMELKMGGDISTNSLGISEPVLPVDRYIPVRNQHVRVVDGELRFDNVQPGRYRVAVKTGNKVAESQAVEVAEASRTSTTLVLGMKHTVTGNVVAADTGKDIAQARVTLSPATEFGAAPEFPDYLSFTDGGGEFVIPEVQPGRYWMVIGATGYSTRTLDNFQVMPGAPPEPTSVTLSKQEPLITVSVTGSGGRPVAHAPLVLMTTGAESPRTYFGKTDEAGLHRFERLLAGRYTLSITAPGDRTRQRTINVTLGEGEVRELPVRFGDPVTVTGKATQGDKPYSGLLSFVLQGAAMADNLVTADEKGNFTVELEPGNYLVGTSEKPGGAMVTIKNAETQTINVELP